MAKQKGVTLFTRAGDTVRSFFDSSFEANGSLGPHPVLPILWRILRHAGSEDISIKALSRTLTRCVSIGGTNDNVNLGPSLRAAHSKEDL